MARFEHPHDRQMRSVPVRPGLLARLREVAVADEALDQWLREVPIRDGFVADLQRAALGDEALDQWLQDVPCRDGWIADLQRSVFDDACLDELLCDTPPAPSGLVSRLQASLSDVGTEVSTTETGEAGEAAESGEAATTEAPVTAEISEEASTPGIGSTLAVGLLEDTPHPIGTAAQPANTLKSSRNSRRRRRWSNVWIGGAIALAFVVGQWAAIYQLSSSMLAGWARDNSRDLLVADWGPLEVAASMADEVEGLVVLDSLETEMPDASDASEIELQHLELPRSGVFHELVSEVSGGLDLNLDVWATRIEHVGYPARKSLPPSLMDEVETPTVLLPGLPRHRGYDRAFHWRYGVSPWVSTGALPRQMLSLHADPRRFERILTQVKQGIPPTPNEVTVEDVMGVLDPRLPLADEGVLGVRTAAGPSIFGEGGASMLQVAVASGAPRNRLMSPARLTILLDVSSEMSELDFLQVQRQLFSALRLLRDGEQLTILTMGGEPVVLCDEVGPEQVEAVRQVVATRVCQGVPDWGRAIPRAVQAALEGQRPGTRQELLIISSGRGEWAESSELWMDRTVTQAISQGVHIQLALCGRELSAHAETWVERMGLERSRGSDVIERSICQSLTGQDATIARDVRVTVEFNPKSVAAYRVLGQDVLAGQWSDDPTPVEMLAGQQKNTLIEVRLQGDADDVGWVELTWHDAKGALHKRRQRVSRLQFAPSFQQSSSSLQQSILAAEAAQMLSQSPFARGRGHEIHDVLDLQWECDEQVRKRPELRRVLRSMGALATSLKAD